MRLAFCCLAAVRGVRGDAGTAEASGDVRGGRGVAAARWRPSRVGRWRPPPCRARRPPPGPAAVAADPGAEADFRDAKARFDAGAQAEARAALEAFAAHHGQHPFFRPSTDAGARWRCCAGTPRPRSRQLEPLVSSPPDPGTASSARYYLGIAEVRLGQYAHGRELLLPFLPRRARQDRGRGAGRAAGRARRGDTSAGRPGPGPGAVGRLRAGRARAREGVRARRATSSSADVAPNAAARTWRASAERGLGAGGAGREGRRVVRAQGDATGATSIDARPRRRAGRWGSTTRRRRRRAEGTRAAWGWRSRSPASFSRSARRRCRPRCWRWGAARRRRSRRRPRARRCSSTCATRAASPSARAAG